MKRKHIVYLLLISFFVIMIGIFNHYLLYQNFNLKSLIQKPLFISYDKFGTSLEYSNDYLSKNLSQNLSEKNKIGVTEKNFQLELTDFDSQDYMLLNLDTNGVLDELNITITAFTDDGKFDYGIHNFFSKKKNGNLILISHKNIHKILIKGVKVIYDDDTDDELIRNITINQKKDYQFLQREIILKNVIVIFMILIFAFTFFLLKKFKKLDKESNEWVPKTFLAISITFGVVFSFLFPLYQIPDEYTHLNMIYSELNMNVNFANEIHGYGDTARIVGHYDEKVNIHQYIRFNNPLSISEKYQIPSITIIRHFPQFIGLIIGDILSLPVLITITLSEILAVLFYSFIGYKVLKLMPIKKEMMMAIMLLPICIQQMGSFSYDVMLLSMCYLLVAYILYFKFDKECISLKDLLKILIILVVIAIVKLPYAFLGMLIFILPIKKINLNFKLFKINGSVIIEHKKKMLYFVIPLVLVLCFFGYQVLKHMYFGRVLLAAIGYPRKSFHMILNTLYVNKFGFIKGLTSEFGWLDTHSSLIFSIFVLVFVFIINFIHFKYDNYKSPFKKWETIYIYGIAVVMIFLLVLAMFDWTATIRGYQNLAKCSILELSNIMGTIPVIGGVQSRYFVPVIPLILLPMYSKKITSYVSKINMWFLILIYYFVVFMYLFILILCRYWI